MSGYSSVPGFRTHMAGHYGPASSQRSDLKRKYSPQHKQDRNAQKWVDEPHIPNVDSSRGRRRSGFDHHGSQACNYVRSRHLGDVSTYLRESRPSNQFPQQPCDNYTSHHSPRDSELAATQLCRSRSSLVGLNSRSQVSTYQQFLRDDTEAAVCAQRGETSLRNQSGRNHPAANDHVTLWLKQGGSTVGSCATDLCPSRGSPPLYWRQVRDKRPGSRDNEQQQQQTRCESEAQYAREDGRHSSDGMVILASSESVSTGSTTGPPHGAGLSPPGLIVEEAESTHSLTDHKLSQYAPTTKLVAFKMEATCNNAAYTTHADLHSPMEPQQSSVEQVLLSPDPTSIRENGQPENSFDIGSKAQSLLGWGQGLATQSGLALGKPRLGWGQGLGGRNNSFCPDGQARCMQSTGIPGSLGNDTPPEPRRALKRTGPIVVAAAAFRAACDASKLACVAYLVASSAADRAAAESAADCAVVAQSVGLATRNELKRVIRRSLSNLVSDLRQLDTCIEERITKRPKDRDFQTLNADVRRSQDESTVRLSPLLWHFISQENHLRAAQASRQLPSLHQQDTPSISPSTSTVCSLGFPVLARHDVRLQTYLQSALARRIQLFRRARTAASVDVPLSPRSQTGHVLGQSVATQLRDNSISDLRLACHPSSPRSSLTVLSPVSHRPLRQSGIRALGMHHIESDERVISEIIAASAREAEIERAAMQELPPCCPPEFCRLEDPRLFAPKDAPGFISIDPARVIDPMKADQDDVLVHNWTDMEKMIYLDKFIQYPKNFGRIASFLSRKRAQDCVRLYYDSKHTIDYKAILREHQQRRRGKAGYWEATQQAIRAFGGDLEHDLQRNIVWFRMPLRGI
mmetsp:Transcript_24047/g.95450  ORF Transcript_24047/g.95450 Transcript_24047/m.95450 type:complete len:858 (+) Transcript_24047:46-2619(+)